MTPRERELLEIIERLRSPAGPRNVDDPAECQRFDAYVKELQGLERRGWVKLVLQRNSLTQHGKWYAAAPSLTQEGRAALEEERRRG